MMYYSHQEPSYNLQTNYSVDLGTLVVKSGIVAAQQATMIKAKEAPKMFRKVHNQRLGT